MTHDNILKTAGIHRAGFDELQQPSLVFRSPGLQRNRCLPKTLALPSS